jgi:superfamily II DNA or RNA helicase
MKIAFNNVWACVTEANSLELEWLDEYTSCEHRVWTSSPNWSPDQRYRLFERATGLFPSGFMKLLKPAAKRDGVLIEIDDQRARPCQPDLDESLVPWLRDYQKDVVWEVVKKGGRGLVHVPTGGGKTEIFIGLSRVLPCEWLFVVHRADLVGQTARRYIKRTGEEAGVWEGKWHRGTSNVTLATFQALHHARRKKNPGLLEFYKQIQAVNVDEVHAQPADSFYSVSLDLTNAYYRVGMSGTPLERSDHDNMRTIAALGPILYTIPYTLLRDRGILSQSKVYMVKYKHPEIDEGSPWQAVYHDLIVGNRARNELLADIAVKAAKPSLMFVEEHSHGLRLQKLMEKRGLKVDFAEGTQWLDTRQRKIKHLVDGDVDVLLSTVIFQEGIDIPSLRSVIVSNGKKSVVAAIQRIGRGMRVDKDTGKTEFEVWDILDRGHKWLTDHALERRKAYESAGHEPIDLGREKLESLPKPMV